MKRNFEVFCGVPDRVIDAPIPDLDRLEYLAKGGFLFTHKEVLPLLAHVARLEAEKQDAHTEGWNAALKAVGQEASKLCGWDLSSINRALSKPTAAKQGDPSSANRAEGRQ